MHYVDRPLLRVWEYPVYSCHAHTCTLYMYVEVKTLSGSRQERTTHMVYVQFHALEYAHASSWKCNDCKSWNSILWYTKIKCECELDHPVPSPHHLGSWSWDWQSTFIHQCIKGNSDVSYGTIPQTDWLVQQPVFCSQESALFCTVFAAAV